MFLIKSLILVLISSSVYAGLGIQEKAINLKGSSLLVTVVKPEKSLKPFKKVSNNNTSNKTDLLKICNVCHSKRAYESNTFLPILAGQNQSYLSSKITLFKKDERNFHPFSKQIAKLSEEDIEYLSFYYADLSSPLDASLVLKEHKLSSCLSCHGSDGNGDELIPAISGQNSRYLSYRIREINNKSSNIHTDKNLYINCQINKVSLLQSNQISNLLSYSATTKEFKIGKSIYQKRCSSCHSRIPANTLALQKELSKVPLKKQSKNHYYHSKIKAIKNNHYTLSQESWSLALLHMLSNSIE